MKWTQWLLVIGTLGLLGRASAEDQRNNSSLAPYDSNANNTNSLAPSRYLPEVAPVKQEAVHRRDLAPIVCDKPMLLIIDISNSVGSQRINLINGAETIVKQANPKSLCVVIFAGSAQTVGCAGNAAEFSGLFRSARDTANAETLGITTRLDRGIISAEQILNNNQLNIAGDPSITLAIVSDGVLSRDLPPPPAIGSYYSLAAACASSGVECDRHFLLVAGADGQNRATATSFTTNDNVHSFPGPVQFENTVGSVVVCTTREPTHTPTSKPVTDAPVTSPPVPQEITISPTLSPTTNSTRGEPPTDPVPPIIGAVAAAGLFAASFRGANKKKLAPVMIKNPDYEEYLKRVQAKEAAQQAAAEAREKTVRKETVTEEHAGVNPKEGWARKASNVNDVPSKQPENQKPPVDLSMHNNYGVPIWSGVPVNQGVKDPNAPSQQATGYVRKASTEEKEPEPEIPEIAPPEYIEEIKVEYNRDFNIGIFSAIIAAWRAFRYGGKPALESNPNIAAGTDVESRQDEVATTPPPKTTFKQRFQDNLQAIRENPTGSAVAGAKAAVMFEIGRNTYNFFITSPAKTLQGKLPKSWQQPAGKVGSGLEFALIKLPPNLLYWLVWDGPAGIIAGKPNAGPTGKRQIDMTQKEYDEFYRNLDKLSPAERALLATVNRADLKPDNSWYLTKAIRDLYKKVFNKKVGQKDGASNADADTTTVEPPVEAKRDAYMIGGDGNESQSSAPPNPILFREAAASNERIKNAGLVNGNTSGLAKPPRKPPPRPPKQGPRQGSNGST